MSALTHIMHIWLGTLTWMAGLGVAFAVLSRFMPCNPGMHWWKNRRGMTTDLAYWLIVPLFLTLVRQLMAGAVLFLVLGTYSQQSAGDFFLHGYGPMGELPLPVQCMLILLVEDVFMYGVHRIFHMRMAWPFHAVHHSTTTLDWTSTQRFHPVNNLLEFMLADMLALLLGFPLLAIVALGPFNIIYSAMVHANLNWTFGPFKYVFASPVFHRWHHTSYKEGGNKNFAPTFPVLDVIFGTFYLPKGRLPQAYGVNIPGFPEGFVGQLVYPFLRKNYD